MQCGNGGSERDWAALHTAPHRSTLCRPEDEADFQKNDLASVQRVGGSRAQVICLQGAR